MMAHTLLKGQQIPDAKEAHMNHALVVNSNDNVANALDDIPAGEQFAFSVGTPVPSRPPIT